ncbi:MAG TPA: hypothetical protein VGR19_05920 [Allosphingosinicella sp.]|nr:hypothetical protein [Allosphingosinicella sp.]
MPETTSVTAPGFYDLTPAQYHADPAPKPSLNSGVAAKLLTETPKTAWFSHPRLNPEFQEQDEKKFDLGSVAHELLLGKGAGIEVLDFPNWTTKAAKEARAEAVANGLQPCLVDLYEKAQAMVAAARVQLGDDPENFDAFTNGRGEVAVLWQEQTAPGKMWMRGQLDWFMDDQQRIYDYKTFAPGADPENFIKYLVRGGKDIQDPFYSRGVASVLDVDWEAITFRFVVQHPEPPFLLSVVEIESQGRQWSYDRSQWAIDKWADCAVKQQYRGFVPRTHHVGIPTWSQMEWEDRRRADELAEQMLAQAAEQLEAAE